jgi:hypothetical protein
MHNLDLIGIKKLKIEPPKLNILKILGSQRDENTYSDILFYLFKSEVGNKFIKNILENARIKYPDEINYSKMESLREYHRLDVTILFNDIKYLIGIENKIDAEEREKQIEDYQAKLEKYYSNYSGVFLFLTPDGREPTTNKKNSKFKCYNISYNDLLESLYMVNEFESIKNCINTFIESIEENIVMNNKDIDTVYEIWGNKQNRDKLKTLLQNRPTILSIRDKLYEKIDKYLAQNDDGIDHNRCSEHSNTELHMRIKSLNRTNIPVIFLFYDWENKENTPSLRIALWHEDFSTMSKKKIKTYKEKDDSLAFEKIRNWGGPWYALYTGKSLEPDFCVTEDHDYKDKLVNILFKAFKKEYEKLRKIILD